MFYNNASVISDSKVIGGNSTDRAILEYITINSSINANIVKKVPFDSANKYSSIILDDGTILIKGAMEVILPKCKNILNSNNKESKLFSTAIIKRKVEEYTKKSGRVLVFAYGKSMDNLTFLGFVNIKDELRREAFEGIRLIKSAGIQTIMITGDAIDTATSIAKEVGLITNDKQIVLTSSDLARMSDEEVKEKLSDIRVVARALPNDKSRLVNIL